MLFVTSGVLDGGETEKSVAPIPSPSKLSPFQRNSYLPRQKAAADLLSLRTWGAFTSRARRSGVLSTGCGMFVKGRGHWETGQRPSLRRSQWALAILLWDGFLWDGFVEQALTQKLLWFYFCLAMSCLVRSSLSWVQSPEHAGGSYISCSIPCFEFQSHTFHYLPNSLLWTYLP